MSWKTIDSAPDSSAAEPLILGWWNQTRDHAWVQIVGFKNYDRWVDVYNAHTVHPTHWAPLLQAPEEKA